MQSNSSPDANGRSRFPDTRWSLVVEAASRDQSSQALEELCRYYWYPLYAFARNRGLPVQDAQDVTQGFFADILRREDLTKVAPERGRFRSFMLTGLKNFISNEFRNRRAAKRGGGAVQLSLDVDFEDRYLREPADAATPETLFQRNWANSILERVQSRLESEFEKAGKDELFQSLREHLGGSGGDGARYAVISEKHGLSIGAVTMAVRRMRRRYGELLRSEIAETVAGPEEVDDEIRFLMSALA